MIEFGTFVFRNGKAVRKGGPEDVRAPVAQSALPRPMIISDTLHDVINPINGKPYDSKSRYYRDVKAAGCSIIGNDTIPPHDNEAEADKSEEIERTIAEVMNG